MTRSPVGDAARRPSNPVPPDASRGRTPNTGADGLGPPRIVVAAPVRHDAQMIAEELRGHVAGFDVRLADESTPLGETPFDLVVMSQEAMTPLALRSLQDRLAAQPPWSEVPIVLVLDVRHGHDAVLNDLRARLPGAKLTVLQRPLRRLELVTAVEASLAGRRRQLQLRDHIAWQEELQRELTHRVRNVLANVVAIYHMTKRSSDTLETFAERFEGRLGALSRVHSSLVATHAPRSLAELADVVLAPYRSSASRIEIEGPALALSAQDGVTLALCLHELATNAVKYGAFSTPVGTLRLTWTLEAAVPGPDDAGETAGGDENEDGGVVRLRWQERGASPAAGPVPTGYGSSFLRAAIRGGLRGRVETAHGPEGFECLIELPADRFETLPPAPTPSSR